MYFILFFFGGGMYFKKLSLNYVLKCENAKQVYLQLQKWSCGHELDHTPVLLLPFCLHISALCLSLPSERGRRPGHPCMWSGWCFHLMRQSREEEIEWKCVRPTSFAGKGRNHVLPVPFLHASSLFWESELAGTLACHHPAKSWCQGLLSRGAGSTRLNTQKWMKKLNNRNCDLLYTNHQVDTFICNLCCIFVREGWPHFTDEKVEVQRGQEHGAS